MAGPWERYGGQSAGQPPQVIEGPPREAPLRAAQTPDELAIDAANARRGTVQADLAERTAADPAGDVGVEQRRAAGFYLRATRSNEIYEQQNVGPRGWIGDTAAAIAPSATNYLTSPERQQAEAAQRDFIAATLRYESGAAIPEPELESQRRIFFPASGDDEATIRTKAELRRNAIESLNLGGGQASRAVVQPGEQADRTTPTELGEPATAQIAPVTGGFREEADPTLAGVNARVNQMLRSGAAAREIISYLQGAGVPPSEVSGLRDAIAFRRDNPNYHGAYDVRLETRRIPISAARQTITNIADTAPGAYVAGAANALTAGYLDELMPGNTEQNDAAKQMIAQRHPGANLLGNVSGGVMGALGGGAAAARMVPALAARGGAGALSLPSMAGDAAYGALYGSGEQNQDRLGGAAIGALAGAGGGMIGRGATNALAAGIGPTGGNMAPLYAAGVRPTPGQRFGGVINAVEQNYQSIPVLGRAVRGARDRARGQFEVGAFNEALGEIGETLPQNIRLGTAPHAYAQRAFNRAYDRARQNLTFLADGDFSTEFGQIQQAVDGLNEASQRRFVNIFTGAVARRVQNGELAGTAYQRAASDIGKRIRSIRSSPSGDGELADALQMLEGALDNGARRHSAPEAIQALDAADAGYARLVRIEEAAKTAGPTGRFTPAQFDAAVKKASGGTRSRAYLRGDALMGDYAEAGRRLSDTIPDSGTPERVASATVAAGGLGYVEPTAAAVAGLAAVPYLPGVRNLTTGAMAPRRSARANRIADLLRRRAQEAGLIAAPGAVQLAPLE